MTEVKAEVPMAEILTYAPGPALADRRPGRVHDGVPALRGGPGPPRAEGGRQGPGGGGSPGLARNYPGGGRGPHARHPDQPDRHRLRHLRADAAARRARRDVPGRRLAARGLRPVHGAGAARGLDPRVRAATSWRCGTPATTGAGGRCSIACAPVASGRARSRTRWRRPPTSRAAARGAAARARSAAPPAPRPRGADQRRPEDAARAGGLQRLRPHAHGRRRGALARRAGGQRPPADRPSQRRLRSRSCGS